MATRHEFFGAVYYCVKGAPEAILTRCKRYYQPDPQQSLETSAKPLRPEQRSLFQSNVSLLASQGLRVIALAYGRDLDDLVLVGCIAMNDPPRPGVAEAIAELQNGNVRVIMITGDAESTAVAIAEKVGILAHGHLSERFMSVSARDPRTMSGAELEKLTERQLQDVVQATAVFFRTTPRHKLLVVKALQTRGEIVAMTGIVICENQSQLQTQETALMTRLH